MKKIVNRIIIALVLLHGSSIYCSQQNKRCLNVKGMLVAAVVGVATMFDPVTAMLTFAENKAFAEELTKGSCTFGHTSEEVVQYTDPKIGNVVIDVEHWNCILPDGKKMWAKMFPTDPKAHAKGIQTNSAKKNSKGSAS